MYLTILNCTRCTVNPPWWCDTIKTQRGGITLKLSVTSSYLEVKRSGKKQREKLILATKTNVSTILQSPLFWTR